jgi:hypothetical protein
MSRDSGIDEVSILNENEPHNNKIGALTLSNPYANATQISRNRVVNTKHSLTHFLKQKLKKTKAWFSSNNTNKRNRNLAIKKSITTLSKNEEEQYTHNESLSKTDLKLDSPLECLITNRIPDDECKICLCKFSDYSDTINTKNRIYNLEACKCKFCIDVSLVFFKYYFSCP